MKPILHNIFEERFRIPSAPLVTGQTTSYETGDDGDLEKGISREYTVLTSGNYSGTTNITVNAKTVALSNNAVIDEKTGLMWARDVPQSDIGPDSDGKLLWKDAVNSEDIFEFCDQANAEPLGGHSDWRVPNAMELISIVDYGQANPPIDTSAFPSTPTDYAWVSTTRPDSSANAFIVRLTTGRMVSDAKASGKYNCRLVRDK